MEHKSNTCPEKGSVHIVDNKGKEPMEEKDSEDQLDDEAPPDEGHRMSSIIHRSFHVPHNEMDIQRNNLFKTRGTIKGRVCEIIIDNGSTDNLISWKAFKKLGSQVEDHPRPYSVSWIHSGNSVTVNKSYKVPLSIGRRLKDEVRCDMVLWSTWMQPQR